MEIKKEEEKTRRKHGFHDFTKYYSIKKNLQSRTNDIIII